MATAIKATDTLTDWWLINFMLLTPQERLALTRIRDRLHARAEEERSERRET